MQAFLGKPHVFSEGSQSSGRQVPAWGGGRGVRDAGSGRRLVSQSGRFSILEESRQMRLHLIRRVINLGCLDYTLSILKRKMDGKF